MSYLFCIPSLEVRQIIHALKAKSIGHLCFRSSLLSCYGLPSQIQQGPYNFFSDWLIFPFFPLVFPFSEILIFQVQVTIPAGIVRNPAGV